MLNSEKSKTMDLVCCITYSKKLKKVKTSKQTTKKMVFRSKKLISVVTNKVNTIVELIREAKETLFTIKLTLYNI